MPAAHPACGNCGQPISITIDLTPITTRLARIERAILQEAKTMAEVDDELTAVEAAETALDTDLTRELADLVAAVKGKLTDAEHAAFQSVIDKLTADKAAIDAADPAPVPVPPAA
jgi:hypothetical protein